jgi:hypothetical protein
MNQILCARTLSSPMTDFEDAIQNALAGRLSCALHPVGLTPNSMNGPLGILSRFIFALFLVLLTFNPTGHSYFHWAQSVGTMNGLLALAGVILLAGWIVVLRATFHSLGFIGVLVTLAFFGALIWVGVDMGLVKLNDSTFMVWLVEIIVAGVLAIGMSWSILRRKLTGQGDVADGNGP